MCQQERRELDGRIKNEDRKIIIAPKDKDCSLYKICFKKENATEMEG